METPDKNASYTEETKIVQFPEVEGSPKLLFTRSDCLTLKHHLGPGWFLEASEKMNGFDPEWMQRYLLVGGKDARNKPRPIQFEETDGVTMAVVAERILDALFLSVHGRTFMDYQIHIAQLLAEAQAKGEGENPRMGPETSSSTSSDTLSGPDSTLQNSTNSLQREPSDTSSSASAA